MKWLHILKLDQCFGEGELVWFLRVKKEKKYTGSPSVVALSMAPTEGNGPYSNSLKDEGYERFKCTDTRGRKGQKREAGEGWRGPIPCLIESPFRTASTSLKNKGRKKNGPLVVHIPSWSTESPGSVFVLSQALSTRAYLRRRRAAVL